MEKMTPNSSSLDSTLNAVKHQQQQKWKVLGGLALVGMLLVIGVYLSIESSEVTPKLTPNELSQVQQASEVTQAKRQQLQEKLLALQNALDTVQADEAMSKWAAKRIDSVSAGLQGAYAYYAQGQFAGLSDKLEELLDNVQQIAKDYQSTLESTYQAGVIAFKKMEYDAAKGLLEKVLQINPSYVDAENLLTRIAIQGDVAKWFEQFKAAKAKGDFQTQIRALEQIVSADVQNHEAHELLAQIKQQSAINHFERLVEQVLEAIKNQQVEEAKNALRKAQQAEPQNPIIATLKTQVQTLSDNQQTQQFSEQLKLFQQSDEWETVALIANKATAQFPDNVNFAHMSQTAEEILRANKKLASYLSRPERLSDVGIKTKATEFLKSIEPLLLQSPKLSKRADLLSREVESYSLKINVIVHSDNRSTLKVLGVGVIGEVNSKQIELKPGRYRFEASRKGYKTEILEVDVQQTIKPLEVTLMCKEKV